MIPCGLDQCSMCGELFEYDKLTKNAGASNQWVCADCRYKLNKMRARKDGNKHRKV